MKNTDEFPFEKAKRVSEKEVEEGQKAIEIKLGIKRPKRGRPAKDRAEKFLPISIRLNPEVLAWAKKEAKRRKVGYQTVINEELMKLAS